MMLCPLKFSRYEFEGGEDCIGAECGFYGSVCDMDMSVSVQKCPNELPEGDAVAILRKAAKCTSANTSIGDVLRYNVPGNEPSAWQTEEDACMALADMVERDYKRRDDYDFVVDALKYMKAEHDKLKKELDIANAKLVGKPECEICDRTTLLVEIEGLTAERDEWKAKVKTLAGYSKYWRGRCAKLEYRSDKRAAAVERLREMQHVDDYGDWVEAIAEVVKGTDKSNIGDYGMWESLIDMLTDDDTHSTTGNMTEQPESLSDEADSREKLEADVRRYANPNGGTGTLGACWEQRMLEFLDRQAAIVEREWQESNDRLIDTMRTTSEQYREKIAELTEQLEAAHAKNRSLKAHIGKMQQGRHGWHVKGVELQRQVDELTAQLHASNAERARLRECLGIATDHAHDFLVLVDESGNVYDRDEGLA